MTDLSFLDSLFDLKPQEIIARSIDAGNPATRAQQARAMTEVARWANARNVAWKPDPEPGPAFKAAARLLADKWRREGIKRPENVL